ncbi:MAG: DUF5655 domain-containing protein [Armatimonadota bacterium]
MECFHGRYRKSKRCTAHKHRDPLREISGHSLPPVWETGLSKHGELLTHLKTELGFSHGDAKAVAHHFRGGWTAPTIAADAATNVIDEIYTGPKATLRPIRDAIMNLITPRGHFDVAPKKGYLSLRRKKQFAMLGPATNTRIELGIHGKELGNFDWLLQQPAGGMCQYKVKLSTLYDIPSGLIDILKMAFESAG